MTRTLLVALLLLAATLQARTNYTGYSGAPGRNTCAISCHGNSNGTVSIDGFPDIYEPGETYELEISRSSGNTINNINGSCRLGTGTANAGQISSGDGTTTYSTNGETNGIRLSSYNQSSATFFWTAPDAGSGQARLYVGAYQGTSMNSGSTTEIELVSEEGASEMRLALASVDIAADDDQDGWLESGESAHLVLNLENTGFGELTELTGILSCQDPRVTLVSSESSWPDMEAGATAYNAEGLVVAIEADTDPVFEVELLLAVTSSTGSLEMPFSLSIGQRSILLSQDVEDGEAGWTHSSPDEWEDDWHISDEDAVSPEHAWKCGSENFGDYSSSCDSRLVSPDFTVLPYSRLRFQHRMEAENSSAYPDSAYDGGILEISVDEGMNWEQLTPDEGYTHAFRWLTGSGDPTTHPFAGSTPCYSGEFDWQEVQVDLSAWEGQEVRLAFRFGSDIGGRQEGWYLDDLLVDGYEDDTDLELTPSRPMQAQLESIHPNPFNPTASIHFSLREASYTRLDLYDMQGRQVRRVLAAPMPAGLHQVQLQALDLPSGSYFLQLQAAGERDTQRITLLR